MLVLLQERSVHLGACLSRDGVRKGDKFDFKYYVSGTQVCSAFFQKALDVSNHIMVTARGRVLENDTLPHEHGNTRARSFGVKKQYLCAFLERVFQEKGNHNPMKMQCIMPQVCPPRKLICCKFIASV
jgi:hypothetical protein